jgi:hypothetical protein
MVELFVNFPVVKRGVRRVLLGLAALSFRIGKAASGRGSVSR